MFLAKILYRYIKTEASAHVNLSRTQAIKQTSVRPDVESMIKRLELSTLQRVGPSLAQKDFNWIDTPQSIEPAPLPTIAFMGRSNVGKSSLLNALFKNMDVATVSDRPGETVSLNYYKLGNDCLMVDMPGYGFAYGKEGIEANHLSLIQEFVKKQPLTILFLLIDGRHGLKKADKEFLQYLEETKTKFQIIMSKCDLVRIDELAKIYAYTERELMDYRMAASSILMVSSYRQVSTENIRKHLISVLPSLKKLELAKDKFPENEPSPLKSFSNPRVTEKSENSRKKDDKTASKSLQKGPSAKTGKFVEAKNYPGVAKKQFARKDSKRIEKNPDATNRLNAMPKKDIAKKSTEKNPDVVKRQNGRNDILKKAFKSL